MKFHLLHFLYHKGTALQHWFSRRIRPAGIGAMIMVSLGGFLCVGQPRTAIFHLFCFPFALTLLALVWVLTRRAKLSTVAEPPPHATVGETIRYTVRVENRGKRKIRGLRLAQTPPDPRPNLAEFASTPEPGEASRNAFDRTMVYYRWQWLTARRMGFKARECAEPFDLPVGASQRVSMELTPIRRGVFPMGDVRALLPDPLGFFQKCTRTDSAKARLVVLPRRYRLPAFTLPGSAVYRIGGDETSNSIGNTGEFVGLREYRPGDPLRQIHWKSWAHTGRPMVKELEDHSHPRHALVLDTFPGSPDSAVFEEMVSLAASFIVGLDRGDCLLDLMFIAGEAHTITTGQGMGRAEKLLEVLAGVEQETTRHYDLLARTVLRHKDSLSSCLIILNGWDDARKDFLRLLSRNGVPCVPIFIGKDTKPADLPGHWLAADQMQRDLSRLPSHLSPAI